MESWNMKKYLLCGKSILPKKFACKTMGEIILASSEANVPSWYAPLNSVRLQSETNIKIYANIILSTLSCHIKKSKELKEAQRDQEEGPRGTQRDPEGPRGTQRDPKEPKGTTKT